MIARSLLCLGILLAITAPARAQKPPAFVGAVQMEEDWRTSGAAAADVDADGRLDLVIASIERGDETHRRLAIHLRRETGFSPQADRIIDLQPEITAFAVGDFSSDPGLEVALLSGSLVAVWRPNEKGAARFRDRFRCRFLYQAPRNGAVFAYQKAVIDIDGDGLDDLLLPEPDGHRAVLQRRGEKGTNWETSRVLSLPPRRVPASDEEKLDLARVRKRARFWEKLPEFEKARTGAIPRAPLVAVEDVTSKAQLIDFDGDGRRDLVARDPFELMIWSAPGAGAGGDPDRRFEAPVVADRSRATDLAYGSHFLDLDGDSRCDAVIFASDRRADDPRTQVLIFLQSEQRNGSASPLFGDKGIPAQLLVLAGFTGGAHFRDIDGDGRPDLAMGALRPDIIDSLRGQAKDVTEVEFYVYLNNGRGFSKAPDLKRELELEIQGLRGLAGGFVARFCGDFTGDGTAELVVRDREERLRVYWTRKDRSGNLSIFDKPLWEFRIDKDAQLEEIDATANEKAGLLVVDSAQVLMLRFAE